MSKQIKVIYEDVDANGVSTIRCSTVGFNARTTTYVDSDSYVENFDAFVQDCFDCGFVVMDNGQAIPVFQIRKFLPNHNEQSEQPSQPVQLVQKNVMSQGQRQGHSGKRHRRQRRRGNRQQIPMPVNGQPALADASRVESERERQEVIESVRLPDTDNV